MAAVEVSALDVLVFKKLVLINHALAKSLSDRRASSEQQALTQHLNEFVLRADAAVSVGTEPAPGKTGR